MKKRRIEKRRNRPSRPKPARLTEWTDFAERREWALAVIEEWSIPEPNSGCWLWTQGEGTYASATYKGQRRTTITRALLMLPRFSHKGLKTTTLCACHRCDTPACVNPDHLFVGTMEDNQVDMRKKGRLGSGRKNGTCRKGHPMTPENTVGAKLVCRTCVTASYKRYRERRKQRTAWSHQKKAA